MIKSLPAKAEYAGSIPGSGRSPGEGNSSPHSSILAWKIPWTEKLDGTTVHGVTKESDMT